MQGQFRWQGWRSANPLIAVYRKAGRRSTGGDKGLSAFQRRFFLLFTILILLSDSLSSHLNRTEKFSRRTIFFSQTIAKPLKKHIFLPCPPRSPQTSNFDSLRRGRGRSFYYFERDSIKKICHAARFLSVKRLILCQTCRDFLTARIHYKTHVTYS